MSKVKKTLLAVMSGQSDNNINFQALRTLLEHYGFQYRLTNGSHIIYFRDDVSELINIQPKGSKAKGYQVKQIREIFNKYKIA